MKISVLFGAAVLVVCGCSVAAAEAFDGSWAVELRTEKGSCDPSRSTTLSVQGGRIEEAGMVVSARGTVDHRGRVVVQVSGGGDSMAARGTLVRNAGSGTWVSPSRQCSGRWSAIRAG